MQHLVTFRRESSAESVASRMERHRIRTGLTGEHTASGDTVYNLFVSDRQVEDAMEFLSDFYSNRKAGEDVLVCPECGSTDVHPAAKGDDSDDYFPLEPRFRLLQKTGDPIRLSCKGCGHEWS